MCVLYQGIIFKETQLETLLVKCVHLNVHHVMDHLTIVNFVLMELIYYMNKDMANVLINVPLDIMLMELTVPNVLKIVKLVLTILHALHVSITFIYWMMDQLRVALNNVH